MKSDSNNEVYKDVIVQEVRSLANNVLDADEKKKLIKETK